jgi:hypothetical protein
MDFIYRQEEKDFYNCPPQLRGIMEIFRVKGRLTGVGMALVNFNGKTGIVGDLNAIKLKESRDYIKKRG